MIYFSFKEKGQEGNFSKIWNNCIIRKTRGQVHHVAHEEWSDRMQNVSRKNGNPKGGKGKFKIFQVNQASLPWTPKQLEHVDVRIFDIVNIHKHLSCLKLGIQDGYPSTRLGAMLWAVSRSSLTDPKLLQMAPYELLYRMEVINSR